MNFGANKTPVEIIKGGAFGGTYFRDIYSSVNNNWYKKSWKEFDVLENIDQKYYCSDYYDIIIILFFIIFYSFSHKKKIIQIIIQTRMFYKTRTCRRLTTLSSSPKLKFI